MLRTYYSHNASPSISLSLFSLCCIIIPILIHIYILSIYNNGCLKYPSVFYMYIKINTFEFRTRNEVLTEDGPISALPP